MPDASRVLIVDDQEVNRAVLHALVAGAGFTPVLAASGEEARRLAVLAPPDIILLDIMMPGESGFTTLEKLKAEERTTDIPVILLSALDDTETKLAGFELGAVDYIAKPFETLEVLARLRTHLKLAEAYRSVIAAQAARLAQVRSAQEAMLVRPEDLPGAGFAVYARPVLEAGGDFYDVVVVGGGFGYFVADVAGHDLSASFVTSGLKMLLAQNAGPLHTPAETLKNMNRVLNAVLTGGAFVSATYAVLDRRARRLEVLCAGHLPPLLVTPGGRAELIQARGDLLGAFPGMVLRPVVRAVSPGERLFLCTDGLIESPLPGEASLSRGLGRLAEAALAAAGLPLPEAVAAVARALLPEGRKPADDVVLLGVEV